MTSLSKCYNKQHPEWHSQCTYLSTSTRTSPSLQHITDKWGILFWTDLQASNEGNAVQQLDNNSATEKKEEKNALQWRKLGQKSELFQQTKMCEWIFVLQSSVCITAFSRYLLKRHKFQPEEEAAAKTPIKEAFLSFALALEKAADM